MSSPESKEYWENIYANPQSGGERGGHENIRFAEVKKLIPSDTKSILDVGAGYAALVKELSQTYPRVVAADFSYTAARASGYNLYMVCSCYEIPFPDKDFDVILSTQMLEYLHKPEEFLQEAKRLAKFGIFTAPEGLSENHNRVQDLTKEGFRELLNGVGTILEFYSVGSLLVGKVKFDS